MKKNVKKPSIKILEGFLGMKQIYLEALKKARTNEILVYGTVESSNILDKNKGLKIWMDGLSKHKLKIKEILESKKNNIIYAQKAIALNNCNHKIKIIPSNFNLDLTASRMLQGDSIIYGDKIALFSSYKTDLYVIVIKSKHISNIYRDLFAISWNISDEL